MDKKALLKMERNFFNKSVTKMAKSSYHLISIDDGFTRYYINEISNMSLFRLLNIIDEHILEHIAHAALYSKCKITQKNATDISIV